MSHVKKNLPTSPANYQTERGLFNATLRVLNYPHSVSKMWWLHNAKYAATQRYPDLLPLLIEVIHRPDHPFTEKDLTIILD